MPGGKPNVSKGYPKTVGNYKGGLIKVSEAKVNANINRSRGQNKSK